MPALNKIIDKRFLVFITNEVIKYYNSLGITFQAIDRFYIIIIAVYYVISNLATNVIHCFYHVSTRGAARGDIFARHLAAHQRIWN